jgi:hypothetical protein
VYTGTVRDIHSHVAYCSGRNSDSGASRCANAPYFCLRCTSLARTTRGGNHGGAAGMYPDVHTSSNGPDTVCAHVCSHLCCCSVCAFATLSNERRNNSGGRTVAVTSCAVRRQSLITPQHRHLQGEGFTNPLTCTFANSSYAATINGTVISPTRAACPSPAWHVPAGEGSTRVRLGVATGGCVLMYRFTYVLDPLVVKVDPTRAPRYGALRLLVQLEDPLPALTPEQVRISGLVWEPM